MSDATVKPVLVQVVTLSRGRQIGWGTNLAEQLAQRLDDIRAANTAGADPVADSLDGPPSARGSHLGEVEASFGLTLTAEAGVILSKHRDQEAAGKRATYRTVGRSGGLPLNGQSVPGLHRFAAAEASQWARRLEQTARPCGCKSGAVMMLAAFVGWPAWVVASGIPHAPIDVGAALLRYAAVVIGSGVVGKLAGIVMGRLRHRRVRRRLAQRLAGVAAERGI